MEGEGRAWDQAREAARQAGVNLVPMAEYQDAERVIDLVGRVWGIGELPFALVRAFQHAGGGLFGAEADGALVGFVLGFLGWQDGLHLHSHMLAVVPEWRSRGIGYALKLAQRAAALQAGVEEVRWTYDPLVARNAWFNLVKLGAVATALHRGFYGEMTDQINKGDRSDRFEVRWVLASERVERALAGRARGPERGVVVLAADGPPEAPVPKATGEQPTAGAVVEVPADHFELRVRDPELGRWWRDRSAQVFQECFDAGLMAVWIDRQGRYVFLPTQEVLG
jgi:predicted GNAT superfamily acetyltransferase